MENSKDGNNYSPQEVIVQQGVWVYNGSTSKYFDLKHELLVECKRCLISNWPREHGNWKWVTKLSC